MAGAIQCVSIVHKMGLIEKEQTRGPVWEQLSLGPACPALGPRAMATGQESNDELTRGLIGVDLNHGTWQFSTRSSDSTTYEGRPSPRSHPSQPRDRLGQGRTPPQLLGTASPGPSHLLPGRRGETQGKPERLLSKLPHPGRSVMTLRLLQPSCGEILHFSLLFYLLCPTTQCSRDTSPSPTYR